MLNRERGKAITQLHLKQAPAGMENKTHTYKVFNLYIFLFIFGEFLSKRKRLRHTLLPSTYVSTHHLSIMGLKRRRRQQQLERAEGRKDRRRGREGGG
jgi:hypothetical protein